MWFDETLASGMVPYHHIIGGENGMGEDRRWLEPAHKYFNWMARHDAHFVNKRSIANIGVVMGQRTHLFYKPPRGALMREYMDGLYYALLEGRFLFDFVHEDKLAPEDLAKYSALLLPNTALLSDEQCRQLRAYVDGGGSLLATFETSLYNERNERRAGFRPGRCVRHPQGRRGRSARPATRTWRASRSSTRSSTASPNTHWIPGAENRVPVAPVESPVLTVVPGFVAYPPELSYPVQPRTNEPAVVVRREGQEPAGVFPRRYRAHHVAVRPYRSGAAAAELHPLGGGRQSAGDDRRRGRDRSVRLGDAGGLRGARPELHQPGDAPRMDPEVLSHRRAEGEDGAAAGQAGDARGTAAGRNGHPVHAAAAARSSSRFPECWTTKWRRCIRRDEVLRRASFQLAMPAFEPAYRLAWECRLESRHGRLERRLYGSTRNQYATTKIHSHRNPPGRPGSGG